MKCGFNYYLKPIFFLAATGNGMPLLPNNAKELNDRVDLIRRNVRNLLKIAKRDSWVCDRFPFTHGENSEQIENI